jgi:hypothetical protein
MTHTMGVSPVLERMIISHSELTLNLCHLALRSIISLLYHRPFPLISFCSVCYSFSLFSFSTWFLSLRFEANLIRNHLN